MSETSSVESVLLELSRNMSTLVQRMDNLAEVAKQQSVMIQKIETRQLGFESSLNSINSVVGVRSPVNADSYVAPSMPVVSSTLGLVTTELYDPSAGGAMEVDETMGPRRSARLAQKPPMRYTEAT